MKTFTVINGVVCRSILQPATFPVEYYLAFPLSSSTPPRLFHTLEDILELAATTLIPPEEVESMLSLAQFTDYLDDNFAGSILD